MFSRVAPWLAVASGAVGLVVADVASGGHVAATAAAVACVGQVTIEHACRYSFAVYSALLWVAAGGLTGAIVTLRLGRARSAVR